MTSMPRLLRPILTFVALVAVCATGSLATDDSTTPATRALPRLVDLGASRCIPCKRMKPILDDLAQNHATHFETVFIDVWEHRDEARRYGIRMIPTQIFFDASGNELFRHEGFMAKKDILAKWKELGVEVESTGDDAASTSAAAPQG